MTSSTMNFIQGTPEKISFYLPHGHYMGSLSTSFTTLSVTFQPLSTAVVVNVCKPRTEAIPQRF